MKIAFIGIGNVGSALAGSLAKSGHDVIIAARDITSRSVTQAREKTPALTALPLLEAVQSADVIFLATPFDAVKSALAEAGPLDGKIVVDCTNPVGPGLSHGLGNDPSGGEWVQRLVPAARVVKAFSIYGWENFEDSRYPGYGDTRPVMIIAGNDAEAKTAVGRLCRDLGWEPLDCGDIRMSLHLEHLALLWIQMGRIQGRGAGLVWAALRRGGWA